jgi:hypothetical protein
MKRRGFLQGIFGGVAATGLIVSASPNEIEAFAAPLKFGDPVVMDQPLTAEVGEHLYNSRGEMVAIVTSITVTAPAIDVTSWADTYSTYVQGHPEVEIRAVGRGTIQRQDGGMPRLRGVKR